MPEAGVISNSTRPRKSGALRRSASPVSKPARSAALSFCAFGVWTAVWPGTKRRRARSRRRTASARRLAARALPGSSAQRAVEVRDRRVVLARADRGLGLGEERLGLRGRLLGAGRLGRGRRRRRGRRGRGTGGGGRGRGARRGCRRGRRCGAGARRRERRGRRGRRRCRWAAGSAPRPPASGPVSGSAGWPEALAPARRARASARARTGARPGSATRPSRGPRSRARP